MTLMLWTTPPPKDKWALTDLLLKGVPRKLAEPACDVSLPADQLAEARGRVEMFERAMDSSNSTLMLAALRMAESGSWMARVEVKQERPESPAMEQAVGWLRSVAARQTASATLYANGDS